MPTLALGAALLGALSLAGAEEDRLFAAVAAPLWDIGHLPRRASAPARQAGRPCGGTPAEEDDRHELRPDVPRRLATPGVVNPPGMTFASLADPYPEYTYAYAVASSEVPENTCAGYDALGWLDPERRVAAAPLPPSQLVAWEVPVPAAVAGDVVYVGTASRNVTNTTSMADDGGAPECSMMAFPYDAAMGGYMPIYVAAQHPVDTQLGVMLDTAAISEEGYAVAVVFDAFSDRGPREQGLYLCANDQLIGRITVSTGSEYDVFSIKNRFALGTVRFRLTEDEDCDDFVTTRVDLDLLVEEAYAVVLVASVNKRGKVELAAAVGYQRDGPPPTAAPTAVPTSVPTAPVKSGAGRPHGLVAAGAAAGAALLLL